MTLFDGDVGDEDEVLDFLTSEAMLTIPDKIEEVNQHALATIVAQVLQQELILLNVLDKISKHLFPLEERNKHSKQFPRKIFFSLQEMFVTALFLDDGEESAEVLHEMEKIDDEADVFKIRWLANMLHDENRMHFSDRRFDVRIASRSFPLFFRSL